MKKSIKKYIKVGTIIKPKNLQYYYKVTELLEHRFKCKIITGEEDLQKWEQEFYYNIDMDVYSIVATNCV